MTDEPEQGTGEGRPKFFNNVTGWIGGLTAVVLALAGLKAAAGELNLFGSLGADDGTEVVSNEEADPPVPPETAVQPQAPPTYYKGDGVTMELVGRDWVVTDSSGETKYDQQGDRNDGMTYARTSNGDYALKWKNDGGSVDLSEDEAHNYYRHYYTVKPAEADAPAEEASDTEADTNEEAAQSE